MTWASDLHKPFLELSILSRTSSSAQRLLGTCRDEHSSPSIRGKTASDRRQDPHSSSRASLRFCHVGPTLPFKGVLFKQWGKCGVSGWEIRDYSEWVGGASSEKSLISHFLLTLVPLSHSGLHWQVTYIFTTWKPKRRKSDRKKKRCFSRLL